MLVSTLLAFISEALDGQSEAPAMRYKGFDEQASFNKALLNPKVGSPSFAAAAAAAPLQHYQVDPVHQPLGLSCFWKTVRVIKLAYMAALTQ